MDDDGFDDAAQPKCPECGTVLVTLRRGFQCRHCDLVCVDGMPSRFPGAMSDPES